MNYSNHNLRTNLQEWKNRLYKATYSKFGQQLKYFLNNLSTNKQLAGILEEITTIHKYDVELFDEIIKNSSKRRNLNFDNLESEAAFYIQFLKYFTHTKSYDIQNYYIFSGSGFEERKSHIIEEAISPIIYLLHDKLDKSNSTIYLLEKYKRRTEWFTKNELFKKYSSANKNYEQILENDLRLFLFDQGIDYPFSTPLSSSGRADIIGGIDTDEPLVIEIKIFDRKKGYGKERIKNGFSQIVKYANDYGKDIGFLVIYNMENLELNFKLSDESKIFPPSIQFNNKTYYFIIINLAQTETASKTGTLKEIEITEFELTKNN